MSNEPSLLIAADNKDVLDEIKHMLSRDLGHYHTAVDDNKAIELFEEHEPQVLLLSHESPEGAERFYLGLFRNSDKIHLTPHQTLLLCKAGDSHTAYGLCDRDIFDDYVVIKPLYDPDRLRLSVRQAISRMQFASESGGIYSELSRFGKLAGDLHGSMKHSLKQGNALRANTQQEYNAIAEVLESQVEELRKRLASSEFRDVVDVRDEAGLKRRFTQFKQECVEPELKQAQSRLDSSLKNWTKGLEADCRKHTQVVGEFEDFVQAIPRQVLVIDDDETYQEILRSILEPEGYKVSVTSDGAQGLGMIARIKPDLILIDFEMPGLNGIEVIRTVKAHRSVKDIPVIMLTGHGKRQVVKEAIEAGAADFVVKPPERTVFLQKIATHMAG